jgi:Domain of unknown function (DUF4279)
MPQVATSSAALRVGSDNLDPDWVTELLGATPSVSFKKGDIVRQRDGGTRARRGGLWVLDAQDREPEGLNEQIQGLLAATTFDLSRWKAVSSTARLDIYCGLFMNDSNEGLTISAEVMRALGDRGIELSLVLYSPSEGERDSDRERTDGDTDA